MSYLESVFCDPKEYDAKREKRITEESLTVNEIYMVMMLLKSEVENRQAAKIPAKFLAAEQIASGLYSVKLGILKVDLTPNFDKKMSSFDGFMTDPESSLCVIDFANDTQYPVKIAYFKDMGDEVDFGPQDIDISLDVPVKELIAA